MLSPARSIHELALSVSRHVPALAERVRREIARQMPEYMDQLAATGEEPAQLIEAAARLLVGGLSQRRLPAPARALVEERARRSAGAGIPLEALLSELSLLRAAVESELEAASASLPKPDATLLAAARRLEGSLERLTAGLAEGYVAAVRDGYRQQSDALRHLMEVARAVNRSLEAPEVAEQGLRAIVRVLRGDAGALWLASAEGGLGLAYTVGLTWAQDRELRLLDDIDRVLAGPAFPGFATALRSPLRSPAGLHGGLAVLYEDHRDLTEPDRRLAAAAADHLGLALARAEQHRVEARTDHVTGLANRSEFERALAESVALAERQGSALSIALIDLDQLKAINDSRGHDAGDAAIRAVADAMRRAVRATDVCARIGGDEFALSMPEADLAQAREVLRRLRLLLPGDGPLAEPRLQVSAGLAAWRPGLESAGLIKLADRRLYEEKRRHRRARAAG